METRNDAVKAQVFPPKEDKRDFGDVDDERDNKEEDLLASLLEDLGMDDFWECKIVDIAQITKGNTHQQDRLMNLIKTIQGK